MSFRVLHLITGLMTGGAENMLARMIKHRDQRFHHSVVSLSTAGEVGEALRAEGIEVFALGMQPRLPNPLRAFALRRIIRTMQPDVRRAVRVLSPTPARRCCACRPRSGGGAVSSRGSASSSSSPSPLPREATNVFWKRR